VAGCVAAPICKRARAASHADRSNAWRANSRRAACTLGEAEGSVAARVAAEARAAGRAAGAEGGAAVWAGTCPLAHAAARATAIIDQWCLGPRIIAALYHAEGCVDGRVAGK
jgi:hypothetical protein